MAERKFVYSPGMKTYRNLMLTMVLGGLWHGASWNYVWWGVFHGLILIIYQKFGLSKNQVNKTLSIQFFSQVVLMFHLTLIGWLLFRCTGYYDECGALNSSLNQILVIAGSFKNGLFAIQDLVECKLVLFTIIPLLIIQTIQFYSNDMFFPLKMNKFNQSLLFSFLLLTWLLKGVQTGEEFIYFQF